MTISNKPTAKLITPSIGAFWPEQGGIYAGVIGGKNGAPDHHLIHASSDFELVDLNWSDAIEAAKKEINGFNDWSLPDQREARLLFINTQDSFDTDEWYWTSAQYAHYDSYAWLQIFSYGTQFSNHKSDEFRARAVRRLLIIK